LKFTDRDPALPGSPLLLEKRKPARAGLRFPFGRSIAGVSGFDFPVSFREARKASLQNPSAGLVPDNAGNQIPCAKREPALAGTRIPTWMCRSGQSTVGVSCLLVAKLRRNCALRAPGIAADGEDC
jgi:hypothetical protein